jgi:hypothetical protein
VAENAPPGMGIIVTSAGVPERIMWLMGYKTGTMISPDHLRRYVFPQYRRPRN